MYLEDLRALVMGVIEEVGSSNPEDVADHENLHILEHDIPIEGYRINNIIVIKKGLSNDDKKWVIAHELGHYFLHGSESTLGRYLNNPLLIKSKIEKEADIFASELLLADIEKYVIKDLTCEQISRLLRVPEKYIKYKFSYKCKEV